MYSCSVNATLMTAPSNRQTLRDDLILLTSMQVPFPRRRDYHSLFCWSGLESEVPTQYLLLNDQRSLAAASGGLMCCIHSYFRVV